MASNVRKVIVIGLDGLDPRIVDAMLAVGELPNLARIAAAGGYSRVATTAPAQTPVAWSSFATGLNPGGHGIFDFVGRDPASYRPDMALNRYEQKNAFTPPRAVNRRGGVPVWDVLANAGVESTILRCPCTYPAEIRRGRLLSGMGVPDMRGGLGTTTFYSTAENLVAGESEHVQRLAASADGTLAGSFLGPRVGKGRPDLSVEFSIRNDAANRRVFLRSSGSPSELELVEGRWSDRLRLKFKAGLLQAARGTVRLRLIRLEPDLEIHATAIHFDPESPPFPVSAPADFARELAEAIGPFATGGMVEDHNGLSNGRFDEHAFLEHCEDAWLEREVMMLHELDRFHEGLFYCLFDTPDRAQHMLWRFREPDHPANRGKPARPELAGAIEDQYRKADDQVGLALRYADDRTLVVALSDHGFGTFRRGVHLNSWLYEHGLLALKPGVIRGGHSGEWLEGVDWERTRAYALGLGGIYLNLRGREGRGVVAPEEAESLKREIAVGLGGLHDAELGKTAIRSVRLREELYRGPRVGDSPDLVVFFAEGYRVSWSSALGGVPEGLIEDNTKRWSGDHIIDPALVPGVLFMNRPFGGDSARLTDLAPTILDAFGVSRHPDMEGNSLFS